jgi:rubrerythrin
MEFSQIVQDVVVLERSIKEFYSDIAENMPNEEISKVLLILAYESGTHAERVESQYKVIGKPETITAGVTTFLSLIKDRISKIKEKADPVDVLREGIEIEGYMEKMYADLANSYETEEQLGEFLGEKHEVTVKAKELFRKISADEKKHQVMLQKIGQKIGYL